MYLFIALIFSLSLPSDADTRASIASEQIMTFPVDRSLVEVTNSFTSLNPYYKQRAGAFYDTEYIGFSASKLFRLANVEPQQMIGTLDIIRGFVFDWLDFYVRGNGSITDEQRLECVTRMDYKFEKLFDAIQYKIYKIWRDDTSGKVNTLNFLIQKSKVGPVTNDQSNP